MSEEAIVNKFPNIKKVCLDIAGCNGYCIPRLLSEEFFLKRLDEVFGAEGVYTEDLQKLEDWIGTLTEDQLMTLAGEAEDTELAALVALSPDQTAKIFEDVFECEMGEA